MKHLTVLFLAVGMAGVAMPSWAETEYTSDGQPTALEEEIRWHLNRGRFDPASENTLRGTNYADLPPTAGPLAPNNPLTTAARHHSEDMARGNVTQHETPLTSGFYDPVLDPDPWDRMEAEGYAYTRAAENIAAGYSTAEAVYVGWFKSEGHRRNMYNGALIEIGNGFFALSGSTYTRYYTMDLGSRGNRCFFTDTLFRDANKNKVYNQGEGVAGVCVRLLVNGTSLSECDVSAPPGSFAVPMQTIPEGGGVMVVLSNTTASALTLSIPRNHKDLASFVLAPRENRFFGTFTRPVGVQNVGWRNVSTNLSPAASCPLALAPASPDIVLRWASISGLQYQPQWSVDLVSWTPLGAARMAGTGGNLVFTDPRAADGPRRFYRLVVSKP
jgi:hypothetical protein